MRNTRHKLKSEIKFRSLLCMVCSGSEYFLKCSKVGVKVERTCSTLKNREGNEERYTKGFEGWWSGFVVVCRRFPGVVLVLASASVRIASKFRQNGGCFLRVCVRGRGMKSEFALLVGDLVVTEWKFDGGTTAPPFAS